MCYRLAICFMKKNCFQRSVNYNYVNGSIFILNYDSWLIRMQVIFLLCLGERGLYTVIHPILLTAPSNTNVFHQVDKMCMISVFPTFWSQGRKAKSKNIIKHILLSKLAAEEEKCLAEIHVVCIEHVALLFFPQTESSQIVTLNLWRGFFVVHLVYLCQNCCELPSGVSLPTVGVCQNVWSERWQLQWQIVWKYQLVQYQSKIRVNYNQVMTHEQHTKLYNLTS